jgi:predicted nuclease of predicted toxin-antitoxin system
VKIKLDENITTAAETLLAQYGHEVDTVADEGLTGAADSTVIDACRIDARMLVTFDIGFGDVRAYPPESHSGIVLLRLADQRPDLTLDVLRRVLTEHTLDGFAGALIVISEDRIRIRRSGPQ